MRNKNNNETLDIVYEDKDIIVVYKPRNLLTIRTEDKKTFSRNLYHYVHDYLDKKHQRPYIVHRLDFDTSGLVIFAKTPQIKEILQKCFEERTVTRKYEAVVRENLETGKTYRVRQYLITDSKHDIHVTKDSDKGKEAITNIEVKKHIGIGSVLDINIETGRRNQIRIALRTLNLTLVGDERYSNDKDKRMYLNEYMLEFPKTCPIKQKLFYSKPLWLDDVSVAK